MKYMIRMTPVLISSIFFLFFFFPFSCVYVFVGVGLHNNSKQKSNIDLNTDLLKHETNCRAASSYKTLTETLDCR